MPDTVSHIHDEQSSKEKAFFLRHSCIEELEKYLLGFEAQLLAHNIGVRWIDNEDSLTTQIVELLPKNNFNSVCFDLSDVPDSLSKSNNFRTVSIEEVQESRESIDCLVVQADFGISETGDLVFIDKPSQNCFNKVNNLIVVLNIDQILIKLEDFSFFINLLSDIDPNYGQNIKIINAPFYNIVANSIQSSTEAAYLSEQAKITVLFYDNGVTNILQDSFLRQSLYCIHCGKCLQVCPLSKTSDFVPPIDLIRLNCFDSFNKTHHIFEHTTLCGNCAEVCPVQIPLVDLLICEMQLVNTNRPYIRNKQLYNIFQKRAKMNKYNGSILHYFFVKRFFGKNKNLNSYFSNIKNVFFNLNFNNLEHNYNNDLEPDDITK